MRLAKIFTALLFFVLIDGAGHTVSAASITFIHGALLGGAAVNNGNPFDIDLVNGSATEKFQNKTGKVIKDFHFEWTTNVGVVRGYDDLPDTQTNLYFGSYTYTPGNAQQNAPFKVDFYDQQNGVGIANNEKFTISLVGFTDVAKVKAWVTFAGGKGATAINTAPVPVPGMLIPLLISGSAMTFLGRRRAST